MAGSPECQLLKTEIQNIKLGNSVDIQGTLMRMEALKPRLQDPQIKAAMEEFTRGLGDMNKVKIQIEVQGSAQANGQLQSQIKGATDLVMQAQDKIRATCGI